MCIGVPMCVLECRDGAGWARGRGRTDRVDLRLVGAVAPGQWVLVFAGAARELLAPSRAAEIDAVLDLVEAAMAGADQAAAGDPGFALPSATPAQQLAALVGAGPDQRFT